MSANKPIATITASTKIGTGLRPYSATLLALGGIILMILGLYFVFLRPPLLPEDPRFMGTTLEEVQASAPGLQIWLRRVFWVMGGYMFTTGLLTCYVAVTSFRARVRGVPVVVALSGLTSIGLMAMVNFIIASDFKWLLLSFVLPWALALALYWIEGSDS
ncbi:hypothetical protein [Polaromonas sp.]|uniref:hypothetical protein n=1 Tax=Polaromonas sp. TaxID=1869339 RepID=UPI0018236538|nr:hypothetical protein [Polaromonas sp.]NMM06329.1 hypothetical protein [Polaromonas sp.]